MTDALVYLDASAIVKLITREAESDLLLDALGGWSDRVSSAASRVEVFRALWRVGAPPAVHARAAAVLAAVTLVHIDDTVLTRASAFKTLSLRALDAIHLATALSLGDDPDAFITYDARLAGAARSQHLRVLQPGA